MTDRVTFDPNDSGPDQCDPTPGRWKAGDDGSCTFDPNDSGPDQCQPAQTSSPAVTQDAQLASSKITAVELPVSGPDKSGARAEQHRADCATAERRRPGSIAPGSNETVRSTTPRASARQPIARKSTRYSTTVVSAAVVNAVIHRRDRVASSSAKPPKHAATPPRCRSRRTRTLRDGRSMPAGVEDPAAQRRARKHHQQRARRPTAAAQQHRARQQAMPGTARASSRSTRPDSTSCAGSVRMYIATTATSTHTTG